MLCCQIKLPRYKIIDPYFNAVAWRVTPTFLQIFEHDRLGHMRIGYPAALNVLSDLYQLLPTFDCIALFNQQFDHYTCHRGGYPDFHFHGFQN